MKKFIFLCFTLAIYAIKSNCQPQIVKDINTQTADAFSTESELVGNIGNYFFFKAASGLSEAPFYPEYEPDLWVTDGTTNGTVKIGDGSIIKTPYILSRLGNNVIFYGNDDAHGSELWVSNGTVTGTHILKDIVTGSGSSIPFYSSHTQIVVFKNKAYFTIYDDTGFLNIWSTDGTIDGTELFKIIGANSNSKWISGLTVMGDNLYYVVSSLGNIVENQIWKTNGTSEGTVLVKAITTPRMKGFVFLIVPTINKLFFTIPESSGLGLWCSDGTASGTLQLLTYNPSNLFQMPILGSLEDKILFNGTTNNSSGLWVSDGSIAGTQLLRNMSPNTITECINYNNKLYFWAEDSNHKNQLWSSDGTSINTQIAINSFGSQNLITSQSKLKFVVDGFLYLTAYEGTNHRLLKTDGTNNILEIVKDKDNKKFTFNFFQSPSLWATPNKLYFINKDEQHGKELWATDGSSTNAFVLKDINQSTNNAIPYGSFRSTVLNHKLYFTAQESVAGRTELWTSDGTSLNTVKVKDRLPNFSREFPQFTGKTETMIDTLNNNIVFSGIDSLKGEELWLSNGTNTGTRIVKDINDGLGSSSPNNPLRLKNKLFFNANDGIHGREMWVSDGSNGGTYMLKDFFTINNGSLLPTYNSVQSKTIYKEKLYFIARDDVVDSNIWETDGTVINTKKITVRGSYSQIGKPVSGLIAHQNKMYFVGTSATSSSSLWSSNGEIGGEQLIKDLYIHPSLNDKSIISFKNWIFVFADNNLGNQSGLWKSNGTTIGTTLLLNINRIDNQNFTIGDDNLFFTSQNILWKTDGTVNGTSIIKTFGNALDGSNVKELNYINGHLYFQVVHQTTGVELWQSNGTPEGTTFIVNMTANHYQDIFDETNKIIADGNRFFFTGNDTLHGRELWTYNTCDNLTNVQSIKSGTWDDNGTWSCGHIPKVTNIATILNGDTVEIIQDTSLKRLKLLDGKLLFNGGNLIFK